MLACAECNGTLSNRLFNDPTERFEHLLNYYQHKAGYKPRVRWDDEDLAEIGQGLRRRIDHMLAKERIVEDKIEYINAMLHLGI